MIAFDHLVLLVHDLDKAAADFTDLGFTVLQRADKRHGSTAFRFISFADGSYFLLTAFTSATAAREHRLGPVLETGEGWADYSFVVPSVAPARAALETRGMPTAGPVTVSNVLAGGEAWSLDLLMTGRGAGGDGALPFLVSDNVGRAQRIPGPSRHANGATGIAGLSVASTRPHSVVDGLQAIGGTKDGEARAAVRIRFSAVWVDVLDASRVKGARPGGGIVDVFLKREAPAANGREVSLEPARTHGASIIMTS